MSQYLSLNLYSQKTINASENFIRLRQDIHSVFDEKAFAIVPKFDSPNITTHDGTAATTTITTSTPSLVTHIFNPVPDAYFNMHYHNVKLLPVRCSIECLFARFAYTVFSPALAAFFLKCETSRRVRVYDPSTGTFTNETRNREQAKALYTAPQSRSASPRKRSRPEGPGDPIVSSAYRLDDFLDGIWGDAEESQVDSGFGER